MATFLYHFYDFSSRRLIDTLPVESARFSYALSGTGTFSGELPLYADDLPADRVRAAVLAYRTKLYVERGGQLVWGGWLHEEPSYSSETGRVTVTAEESLGYFARRFLPTLSYTGVEQLAIARNIISVLQAEPGGDMWITLDPSVTSGQLRDRNYNAYDKTDGLTALSQLSEVIAGFEYATQTIWDGSMAPLETLLLAAPQLGRRLSASGMEFDYDRFTGTGNLEQFGWAGAGTAMATRTWAQSETDEGVQLTAYAERPDLVAGGYPLMEATESFDRVSDVATLQAHADALSAYRAGSRIIATARAKAQPGRLTLGDWQMGDDVLCRISDWKFPPDPSTGAPGFTGWLRMVGCEVTPGEDGTESYDFTLGDFLAT